MGAYFAMAAVMMASSSSAASGGTADGSRCMSRPLSVAARPTTLDSGSRRRASTAATTKGDDNAEALPPWAWAMSVSRAWQRTLALLPADRAEDRVAGALAVAAASPAAFFFLDFLLSVTLVLASSWCAEPSNTVATHFDTDASRAAVMGSAEHTASSSAAAWGCRANRICFSAVSAAFLPAFLLPSALMVT